MDVVMGLAPRTRREASGLCVVEVEKRRGGNGQKDEHYVVRHLERLPAATSFPKMAERCGELAKAIKVRTGSRPETFVDLTGFGQPLLDLVKQHGDFGRLKPVYFTHGDQRTEEGGIVRLGKCWVVTRLQLLLQSGRLHLPRSPGAEILAVELNEYEVQVAPDANDRYGAFRVGSQDELVTALGLAVQRRPLVTVEHAWIHLR
jgi:hypothetical protein